MDSDKDEQLELFAPTEEKLDKNGFPVIRNEKGKFPKGVSGNPKGRPKQEFSIQAEWQKFLKEKHSEEEGISRLNKLMSTTYELATEKKSEKAIEIIYDRTFGKAKTTVELSNKVVFDISWGEGNEVLDGQLIEDDDSTGFWGDEEGKQLYDSIPAEDST